MSQYEPVDMIELPKAKGGMSISNIVLLIGILAVVVVFGIALWRQQQAQPTSGPAPTFTFTTFEGETYDLADFKGKVVVLNFWAGWCIPCKDEAPELQSTWEYYQAQNADVVFLGIAYADNGPSSLKFLGDYNITYLNAPDLGTRISDLYNINGVPETFIIDKNGNVVEFIYAGVTQERLMRSVERALAGVGGAG
ncbi:MAG: redoxin domain-containing protein [Anaerolineae bacterium]|jgi:cytochrome c biogenesis protein CcmG/thiol:disulfide interchange protein DsbE|nr:redoxin domain-containing protein [Anaerolineae bacterium]